MNTLLRLRARVFLCVTVRHMVFHEYQYRSRFSRYYIDILWVEIYETPDLWLIAAIGVENVHSKVSLRKVVTSAFVIATRHCMNHSTV